MEANKIYTGDALTILKTFPENSINCCVTSPPYWALRDYEVEGQLGAEETFFEYLEKLWFIFDEVRRVLREEGTCFVNLGDTYSQSGGSGDQYKYQHKTKLFYKGHAAKSLPKKCLCQIPNRFAIGMTDRGWVLRNVVIWHKPNALPHSTKDRFTVDFEYVFFFTKNPNDYYFKQQTTPLSKITIERCKHGAYSNKTDKYSGMSLEKANSWMDKVRNGELTTSNMRAVWTIGTQPSRHEHFATFPRNLIRPMIDAGCPKEGIILDPFMGSGTTAIEALAQCKQYIGIEMNPEYAEMARERIREYINENPMERIL